MPFLLILLALAILSLCSVTYALIMPSDQYGLVRYIVLRIAAIILGNGAILGGVHLWNYATPDDWFKVEFTNDQKVALLCVLFLVNGMLVIWA